MKTYSKKDFPQFRDIPPNSLYKSMGYPHLYKVASEKESHFYNSVQNRKNENLLYRDDFYLKYGNDALSKQVASGTTNISISKKGKESGPLLNLSVLGTRL